MQGCCYILTVMVKGRNTHRQNQKLLDIIKSSLLRICFLRGQMNPIPTFPVKVEKKKKLQPVCHRTRIGSPTCSRSGIEMQKQHRRKLRDHIFTQPTDGTINLQYFVVNFVTCESAATKPVVRVISEYRIYPGMHRT